MGAGGAAGSPGESVAPTRRAAHGGAGNREYGRGGGACDAGEGASAGASDSPDTSGATDASGWRETSDAGAGMAVGAC